MRNFKERVKNVTRRLIPTWYSDFKIIMKDNENLCYSARQCYNKLLELSEDHPYLEKDVLFLNVKNRIKNYDYDIIEEKNRLLSHYFLSWKKIKEHILEGPHFYDELHTINYGLKLIEEDIQRKKPKGKQIFSTIDPYGEESWED